MSYASKPTSATATAPAAGRGIRADLLCAAMQQVSDEHPGDLIVAYRLSDSTPEDVAEWVAEAYNDLQRLDTA